MPNGIEIYLLPLLCNILAPSVFFPRADEIVHRAFVTGAFRVVVVVHIVLVCDVGP